MVKEIRGRSGAGSASAHGLAPQNLSPDKHVDVCVDSEEDRGSTPLASKKRGTDNVTDNASKDVLFRALDAPWNRFRLPDGLRVKALSSTILAHVYEIRPRKDRRGFD